MPKKLLLILFALLPSRIMFWLLNRSGHSIDQGCRNGVCYLDIDHIVLGRNACISSSNLFKGLKFIELGEGARIGGFLNWFTASPLHQQMNPSDFGRITIGSGSNITSRHFFDAQRTIKIGADTLIAGFNSTFWTHGYRGFTQGKHNSIEIGDHCYIGSHSIFVPGAQIADNTIVAAGSVVTKDHTATSNILLAGNPAAARKHLPAMKNSLPGTTAALKPSIAPTTNHSIAY